MEPSAETQKPYNFFANPFVGITAVVLLAIISFGAGAMWMKYSGFGGTTKTTGNAAAPSAETSPLDDLAGAAKAVGVNQKEFEKCFESGEYADLITKYTKLGSDVGISGTPGGFLININTGKALQVRGAMPYANAAAMVDSLLDNTVADADLYTGKLPSLDDLEKNHIRSNNSSITPEVILYEYSDYQCPYCKQFHPTVNRLLEDYSGRLVLAYRHFPLESIHPKARPASEASECVYELGGDDAFWKFTDYLFEN